MSGTEGPPAVSTNSDRGATERAAVRLPTWVVIVLLVTLVASCSAASAARDAADSARGAQEETFSGSGFARDPALDADVIDLCRLLGAVATSQEVDLDALFADSPEDTQCRAAARGLSVP